MAQPDAAGDGHQDSYVLLGWPLHHSLSPAMHNAAFAALGIDARYALRPTPADDLPRMVGLVRDGELAGANITIPYKETVLDLVDRVSPVAKATRAANTVVRDGRVLRAENTDPAGFRCALNAIGLADAPGARAIVVGAGGAARAVAHTLLSAGWQVEILARRFEAAAAAVEIVAAAHVNDTHPRPTIVGAELGEDSLVAATRRALLLVNATPVGSLSESARTGPARQQRDRAATWWPANTRFPGSTSVIDLVAWPPETHLVDYARAAGARAIGGLPMLIGQAERAFELWIGHSAPTGIMRTAALAAAAEHGFCVSLPESEASRRESRDANESR